MDLNKLYFYTASILNYKKLLMGDDYKEIIIGSLRHLVQKKKIKVYAFVIMPNHIHVLWRIRNEQERKNVQGAFLSFTAHAFKKLLQQNDPSTLNMYYVNSIIAKKTPKTGVL